MSQQNLVTVSEMKSQYGGEWVLADVVETDENGFMVTGRVIAHGPDRDAVYAAGESIAPPRRFASFCFREPAEGTAIVL